MKIFRPWGVIAAIIVTSPALHAAFVSSTMGVDTALLRFLIAVPVCSVAISAVVAVMDSYAAGFGVRPPAEPTKDRRSKPR